MTANELGDYIKARLEDALDKGGFPEVLSDLEPNQWWCPHCGHTQNAPVADQPGPEPSCPTCDGRGIVAATPGQPGDGYDACPDCGPRPVPVGDERCGDCGHRWQVHGIDGCEHLADGQDTYIPGEPLELRFCVCAESRPPVGVPPGDDTPTSLGEWTVHRGYGVRHIDGDTLWCHTAEQGPSPALATLVADALNRAGAAPDLTALADALDETPCESSICLEAFGREHMLGEHEIWEWLANRPVGGDTPAPYTAISAAERQEDAQRAEMGGDTPAGDGRAEGIGMFPKGTVSDDTPAPTAQWTAERYDPAVVEWLDRQASKWHRDGQHVLASWYERASAQIRFLNRAEAAPGQWTVGRSEGSTEICNPPGHVKLLAYGHDHPQLAAQVADLLNRAGAAPDLTAHREQFIITAGTNIHSPVGPFGSHDDAEDHYKANQPQGQGWLAQPTIVCLLRPAAVAALVREDTTDG